MINNFVRVINRVIFSSRWLQAPLYLGLVAILGIYAYRFLLSLLHLFINMPESNDTEIMLEVLDLVDVVMIANLLIMVIMGGYETFVTRLGLHNHPDQPEWLDELDAGTMKVKLALALVGISSIHLLRTFIESNKTSVDSMKWQVFIHLTLVVSAIAIAYTNSILFKTRKEH